MAKAPQPYVEDYNSMISEVVPFTRRGPERKRMTSTLSTHCEGVSDSGYDSTQLSSDPPSTLSPIESRSGTPENDSSSSQTQQLQQHEQQKQEQDHQQQLHQQLEQHLHDAEKEPQRESQREPYRESHREQRDYYRDRDYQRSYYQDYPQQRESHQEYNQQQDSYHRRERSRTSEERQHATPMARRQSSHFSSQASSQMSSSSSNPTPSGSRHNSVKARSRDASPAVHGKHTAGDSASADCDCADCNKSSKSPQNVPSALSTPWNLNYPPFNTVPATHPTPPYGSSYAGVSPMRSYDYYNYPPTPVAEPGDAYTEHRRPRDRAMPARPLSYGGVHPVSSNSAYHPYGYYAAHLQNGSSAPIPTVPIAQPYSGAYAPPPINTSVPPPSSASSGSNPYSSMVGGAYSAYPYSPAHDYWNSTPTSANPTTATGSDYSAMPPPPIPIRRATNRLSSGAVLGSSPRNSPGDYHEKYARRYAEEYADKRERHSGEGYVEKYARRYAEEYPDRYNEKYSEYHQTSSPISRRMSQRTSQTSGAYSYLRDEAPRSTSVPPSEANAITESRRKTVTPQPTPTRSRRDSSSTTNSAGIASALARVPRPIDTTYDDYAQTPPTQPAKYSVRYDIRYDPRYDYDHQYPPSSRYPVTPSHQTYRGSDSSGASSGGSSGDMYTSKSSDHELATSDGESDSFAHASFKHHSSGGGGSRGVEPILHQSGGVGGGAGGRSTNIKNENVEYPMTYRYVPWDHRDHDYTTYTDGREYYRDYEHERVAVQWGVSEGGKGGRRELEDEGFRRKAIEYHSSGGRKSTHYWR